ncbi:peptidoglycan editing factor PgeF [soil metagenome]
MNSDHDIANHERPDPSRDWLRPDWPVSEVDALMTTRAGGVSEGPWRAMNLGVATGDDPLHVAANRAIYRRSMDAEPVYLQQVHGTRVVELTSADISPQGMATHAASQLQADACFTTQAGISCTVMAADCLPLLFAAPDRRAVAAAHAGWRGLAAGVIEATVARLTSAASCHASELHVWLGACIGPERFQVGADVLAAFTDNAAHAERVSRFKPDSAGKWLADLPGLARDRLEALGIYRIHGGSWCTVTDESRFFSYRRDGTTGRMAASIWIRP